MSFVNDFNHPQTDQTIEALHSVGVTATRIIDRLLVENKKLKKQNRSLTRSYERAMRRIETSQ